MAVTFQKNKMVLLEHKLDVTLRCKRSIKALTYLTSELISWPTLAVFGMMPNMKKPETFGDTQLAPSGLDMSFTGKRHVTTQDRSCLTFQIISGRCLIPNHSLLTNHVNLPMKST